MKKAESKFVALDIKPEYVIDKINNGYVSIIRIISFCILFITFFPSFFTARLYR